jgi:ABC-type amino acid transport substrate-binding protein
MKIKKILSASMCLFFLTACGEKTDDGNVKPLVVITSPDNPPFEFKDTSEGGDKVIGFDMDVIYKLGERLGRPIKVIEGEFASIIPSLQSGRADMAIAEFSATEERRKSVDFSDTYYKNTSSLLVLEDSPIISENDLKGKKLGVQLGSTNEILGRKLAETNAGLTQISLVKIGDLVQELKVKRLQAILIGDTAALKIAKSMPGFRVVAVSMAGGELAIVFPKGSSLVIPVNEALKRMQGDVKEIEKKWITQ